MQVEVYVTSVRDEDALSHSIEALFLQLGELFEEAGHMENDARTDQVHAVRTDEARWEEMEAVRNAVRHCSARASVPASCVAPAAKRHTNGMSGIVATSSPSTNLCLGAEDVGEFSCASWLAIASLDRGSSNGRI